MQQVVKDFGKLDVLIANAGIGQAGGIIDMTLEDWRKMVDVNCE